MEPDFNTADPDSEASKVGSDGQGGVDPLFTENHKRRLLSSCQHVANELSTALHRLASADPPSPFQRFVPDALPIQRKVLADYIARVQTVMAEGLERNGVNLRKPVVSSLWSFRTTLMSTRVSIDELAPKYIRGYGALSPAAVHALEVFTAELSALLDQIDNYLATGPGTNLRERLERQEKTGYEAQLLKVIEEVITTHGVVELRPLLGVLVERLESTDLEITVFGRVSSGKSSLLNHILRTDVLPVGVAPITAVPTRIRHGSHAQLQVAFADNRTIVVPPEELASYVTEQANPENAKHVARIEVELPIERLQGVTFVDTPGLGSVSRNGELESLAYLPRCDIGIVLVDASSTLTPDDAAVVHALYQAGADVMVLLNKVDILTNEDRLMALRYTVDRLQRYLGQEVPVFLTAVKGDEADLCDQWFQTALVPRLNAHRELARASLRRKAGLLREATVAALLRRLGKASGVAADAPDRPVAVARALRDGLAALEKLARDGVEFKGLATAEKVLDVVAQQFRAASHRGAARDEDVCATVVAVAQEHVSKPAVDVAKAIQDLRTDLSEKLQAAHDLLGLDDVEDLPVARGMPAPQFSLPPDVASGKYATTLSHRWFGERVLRHRIGSELAPWLTESFDRYMDALRQWRSLAVDDLRRAYSTSMALCLAEIEEAPEATDRREIERDIARLQAVGGSLSRPDSACTDARGHDDAPN